MEFYSILKWALSAAIKVLHSVTHVYGFEGIAIEKMFNPRKVLYVIYTYRHHKKMLHRSPPPHPQPCSPISAFANSSPTCS